MCSMVHVVTRALNRTILWCIAHGEIELRAESLDYGSYYYYSKFTTGIKLPDWVDSCYT